jgi:hypothetical protein
MSTGARALLGLNAEVSGAGKIDETGAAVSAFQSTANAQLDRLLITCTRAPDWVW